MLCTDVVSIEYVWKSRVGKFKITYINYFYWIFSPHWTFHLPLMHILLTDACKIFMMSATNRCGQVAIFACRFLQISAKILISICLDFSSVNNFILFDIGISFWNFYIIIRLFLKRLLRMKIIIIKDFLLVLVRLGFTFQFSHYICLYRNRNYTTNA